MLEIGHSSSSRGANAGSRGKATRMLVFSELALCLHAVRGDLPQGAKIAS